METLAFHRFYRAGFRTKGIHLGLEPYAMERLVRAAITADATQRRIYLAKRGITPADSLTRIGIVE